MNEEDEEKQWLRAYGIRKVTGLSYDDSLQIIFFIEDVESWMILDLLEERGGTVCTVVEGYCLDDGDPYGYHRVDLDGSTFRIHYTCGTSIMFEKEE